MIDFNKKIGVLGGGQLGRMIMQEALKYSFEIHVLDNDPNAPCRNFCDVFSVGSLMDYDTVLDFGKDLDVITIEIEHVNADALQALEDMGKEVYPRAQVLKTIQDKGLQKQFYRLHKIPTAEYRLIDNKADLDNHLDFLPAFQKLRKFGYDGRGVQLLRDVSDLDKAFEEPSLLEKLVDIDKELAVIVTRNANDEVAVFPPVELVFDPELNLVDYLLSPANIDDAIADEATRISRMVVDAFDGPGIYAIELFLTKAGDILVNEVAPRVHNSGHHSIEGNFTSQFEQQLRVVGGMPPGNTGIRQAAAMVNILGAPGFIGAAKYEGMDEILQLDFVYIHLYGKVQTRPGRKMGHATVVGANLDEILDKVKKIKRTLKVVA